MHETYLRKRILSIFALLTITSALCVAGQKATDSPTPPVVFAEGTISTPADETTPVFAPDEKTAFFMRYSSETGNPAIFISTFADGKWIAAKPAELPANSGGPSLAPDGSKIFFWSVAKGAWAPHLWMSEKTFSGWGPARALGAPLDGDGELSPSVVSNGTLYFAAMRKETQGGFDVYRSRLVDGKYIAPEGLGEINSQYDEISVSVAPDESFLVLCSRKRPDSVGEGDLYLSVKQGEGWSAPLHLGAEINTAEDESNPRISTDKQFLYFTRGGDIYRVSTAAILPGKAPYAGPWIERASMPTGRLWAQAIPWRGKVYVINGFSGWGQGSHGINALEEYDPIADRWEKKADSPSGANWYVPALANDGLHLYAGKDKPASYRYSSSDNSWQSESGLKLPWDTNQNTATVAVAGRMFALKCVWSGGAWVSSLVEYEPATSTWVTRRSPPLAAPGTQMAVVNGRIYLVGSGEKFNKVEEYDPARDLWTYKSPMPTGRVEVRVAALNGKIYAVGGHSTTGGATLDAVEEYDVARDSWRTLPPLPEPRWGVAAAAVNGTLYVFGGGPDAVGSTPASNKVWVYSENRSEAGAK